MKTDPMMVRKSPRTFLYFRERGGQTKISSSFGLQPVFDGLMESHLVLEIDRCGGVTVLKAIGGKAPRHVDKEPMCPSIREDVI